MSDSAARAFWLANVRQPLLAYSNLANAVKTVAPYTPDELDLANTMLLQELQSRGIEVDNLDELAAALPRVKANELLFWSGSYLLRSDSGQSFRLQVLSDSVVLASMDTVSVLMRAPIEHVQFEAQSLLYEDGNVKVQLEFYYPSDQPSPPAAASSNTRFDTDTPRIRNGRIETKTGAAPATYTVSGKLNTYTAAGLASEQHGDPLDVWAGRYVTRYVDGDFAYLEDIVVSADDGALQVLIGDVAPAGAMLRNNTLVLRLASGARIGAHLACSPSGTRSFKGVVEANGFERPIIGTADAPYVDGTAPKASAARRAGAADAPPDFCATNVDQTIALPSLGRVITPTLTPIAVTYADGTAGTIEITPVRQADLYAVPPGQLVAYHQLDANGQPLKTDASLAVGWLAATPVSLLPMVEADYYQLRLTFGGWYCFDQAGIDVSLVQDDPTVPRFISLTSAAACDCPAGTGGYNSPVSDFTNATTLISANANASGKSKRQYRFQLSGKGKAADNSVGSNTGFLRATLAFKTKDGTAKLPSRVVSIPLLVDVNLPVDIRAPLKVTGADSMQAAYADQAYRGTVHAEGGVPPYVWQQPTPLPPDGLSWSVPDNDANRASFELNGTWKNATPDSTYTAQLSVQSNPRMVVSRPRQSPVSVHIRSADPQPAPPLWTTIAVAAFLGIGALSILGLAYSMNKDKLSPDNQRDRQDTLKSNGNKALGDTAGTAIRTAAENVVTEVGGKVLKGIDAATQNLRNRKNKELGAATEAGQRAAKARTDPTPQNLLDAEAGMDEWSESFEDLRRADDDVQDVDDGLNGGIEKKEK